VAEGLTVLTAAQLSTIGKYAPVQFIWEPAQSSNLLFSVPFTDVDGTVGVHPITYLNLAALFEATEGGAEDVGKASATRVATESHDASFTAVGALTAKTGYCTPTMDVMGVGNQWRDDTAGGDVATYNGDGGSYQWITEVDQNTVHHIAGWAPHGVLCIPFGDQMTPEDWYNVSDIGNLKMTVTDGQTTTTSKIFLQQNRSYAP